VKAYLHFWILGLLLLFTTNCKVEFDNTMPFFCEEDDDCGGDGYVCIQPPRGGSAYCCKDDGEGIDFNNDAINCGSCGNVCPTGKKCSSGVCR